MADPLHISSMDSNESSISNKDHHFNQGQNIHYPYGFTTYTVPTTHQNFTNSNHYANNFANPFQTGQQRDNQLNVAFDLSSNRNDFIQQAQQTISSFFPRQQPVSFDLTMKQGFVYGEKSVPNFNNQQQQNQDFNGLVTQSLDSNVNFEMPINHQQIDHSAKIEKVMSSDFLVSKQMNSHILNSSLISKGVQTTPPLPGLTHLSVLPDYSFGHKSAQKPPKKKKSFDEKAAEAVTENSPPLKKQNVLENLKIAFQASSSSLNPSSDDTGPKGGKSKDIFPCPHCEKSYSHKPSLRKHIAAIHDEMRYPCPTCGLVFTQRTGVRRHVNAVHLKEVSFTCDICGKNFFRKALLKLHQRVHSGEKPYLCQECGKSFPKNSSFKRHMRFHNGTKAYACKLCGRTFNEKYNLKAHLLRAHKMELDEETGLSLLPDKPLIKSNDHRTVMFLKANSEKIVSLEETFRDLTSQNEFSYGNSASQLLTNGGCTEVTEAVQCLLTGPEEENKGFSNGKPITGSSGTVVDSGTVVEMFKNETDTTNGEEFQGGQQMVAGALELDERNDETASPEKDDESQEHDLPITNSVAKDLEVTTIRKPKKKQRRNGNGNEYACKECGKTYLNPSSVYVHINATHKQRRFSCDQCSKDFMHKQHLVRHLESAHSIKMRKEVTEAVHIHKCDVCKEQFSSKKALKRHVHTHVQGFKCGYCKSVFPTKDEMWQHIPTHQNDWVHQCTICGERFEKVAHLNRHLPSHLN